MNLLYLTPSFPPMVGGGETYAAALAQQMAQRGHAVTIITSDAQTQADFWHHNRPAHGREPSETISEGLRVIRCPLQGIAGGRRGLLLWRKAMVVLSIFPGRRLALLEAMARSVPPIAQMAQVMASCPDIDLIHGFNISWEYPLVLARHLAEERRLPLVVTPFAHLGSSPRDRVALNNTMQHQMALMRQADALLALTQVEANELARRGIAQERLYVLPAGLAQDGASGETLLTPETALPRVCFVGRNSRDKGAMQLLQACARLWQRGRQIELVMMGPRDVALERMLASLPQTLQEHIRILGLVDEITKQQEITAAKMLVLPSRVDSFGIVFLEAWKQRKPVIGARSGGIPGLIHEGQDGLLVDHGDAEQLADAIERLIGDPELATALGESGFARLQSEFNWKVIGDRLSAIYAQVLDPPTATSRRSV